MIEIVTGPINSGKSSWMLADFARHDSADGFICVKVRENDIHTGYDLLRPLDNSRQPFIRKIDHRPPDWNEVAIIGRHYSFCHEGFAFAEMIADQAIKNQVCTFFLDELGPLELSGKGFAPLLTRLLHNPINLVLTVRETLVSQIAERFALRQPRTFKPHFRPPQP